jgi:Cu2+-containing amine oxidase
MYELIQLSIVQDTSRACLNCNSAGLIEFVGEDIFVVGQCDNKPLANYEYIFAYKFDQSGGITVEARATGILNVVNIPSNDSAPGAPVGMLPPNSIVLFMEANHIRKSLGNWRTGRAVVTRNRELVVQFIITLANYEYIFAYKFDQSVIPPD